MGRHQQTISDKPSVGLGCAHQSLYLIVSFVSPYARDSHGSEQNGTFVLQPPIYVFLDISTETAWQATGYKKTFGVGCLRRIHGRITTSPAARITVALPNGLLKVTFSANGNPRVVCYGSMAFVCESFPIAYLLLTAS